MSHKSELLAGLYERTVSKLPHHKGHDVEIISSYSPINSYFLCLMAASINVESVISVGLNPKICISTEKRYSILNIHPVLHQLQD